MYYQKIFGKDKAFTLAEVLSVVVILGVVAAIMIPSTITKVQKRETLTRFRIAYNLLTDITERARIENGGYPPSNMNSTDIFNTYFRPYLSIARDCGTGNQQGNDRCFAGQNGSWYNIDNGNGCGYNCNSYYKVILKNGMSLAAGDNSTAGFNIFVDINGPKKGYSKLGQDVFMFSWVSDSTLAGCASCSPHQSNVPELIPGPIEYTHGGNWVDKNRVNTIYYYQPTAFDRGVCRDYTELEKNYSKADSELKPRIDAWKSEHNNVDWLNLNAAKNSLRQGGFTEEEINAYSGNHRRQGLGVSAGAVCSIEIVRNGLNFPNDYPWSYANQKPDNFQPVR